VDGGFAKVVIVLLVLVLVPFFLLVVVASMCTVGSQEDEKPLAEIATMAHPSDNCAIATSSLRQGTRFSWRGISVEKFGRKLVRHSSSFLVIRNQGCVYRLSHTILEGHRFAIERIAEGGEDMREIRSEKRREEKRRN